MLYGKHHVSKDVTNLDLGKLIFKLVFKKAKGTHPHIH